MENTIVCGSTRETEYKNYNKLDENVKNGMYDATTMITYTSNINGKQLLEVKLKKLADLVIN